MVLFALQLLFNLQLVLCRILRDAGHSIDILGLVGYELGFWLGLRLGFRLGLRLRFEFWFEFWFEFSFRFRGYVQLLRLYVEMVLWLRLRW